MDEEHDLAAQALLQQLLSAPTPTAPAPIATPTAGPASPAVRSATVAPPLLSVPVEAALAVEERAAPEPALAEQGSANRFESPGEEPDRCSVCGAVLAQAGSWCQLCLTPRQGAAATSVFTPSPMPLAAAPAASIPDPPGVARSAIWLAVVVIAFNIAVQASTYALERSAKVQPDTAISIGLWVGMAFYLVIAAYALGTRAAASVRTAWTIGDSRLALQKGLLVGGLTSTVVLGLQSLATHHLAGDPTVQLVVSDGSVLRVLAAFFVFVGIGPLVEEYIFRGVLAESLRGRGLKVAIGISAVLFALAHLRPAGLVYYSAIGGILGRLYFRYGMKASVTAHAVFNGLLVGAAILSVIGPSKTFVDDGAVLHLPAAWKSITPPTGVPFQFAAEGPEGTPIPGPAAMRVVAVVG